MLRRNGNCRPHPDPSRRHQAEDDYVRDVTSYASKRAAYTLMKVSGGAHDGDGR